MEILSIHERVDGQDIQIEIYIGAIKYGYVIKETCMLNWYQLLLVPESFMGDRGQQMFYLCFRGSLQVIYLSSFIFFFL